MSKLDGAPPSVREAVIYALSSMDNEKALLHALELVKGHDWDPYAQEFGQNYFDIQGNFLMFRSRPTMIHDNRAAMIARIEGRLLRLKMHEEDFRLAITQTWQRYSADSQANEELLTLKASLESSKTQHIRYVAAPILSGCKAHRNKLL
jgi:hypothetical protein